MRIVLLERLICRVFGHDWFGPWYPRGVFCQRCGIDQVEEAE